MSDSDKSRRADVVRQELRLFLGMADRIGIDGDRQRRFLRMSQDEWQQLLAILQDERLPPHPALPLLVRHLGYLTSRLDRSIQAAAA
ncbi:MAG: hypothetical protein WB902_02630 [Acetobacteraceae bacterium]|jgi:hypothetical protein